MILLSSAKTSILREPSLPLLSIRLSPPDSFAWRSRDSTFSKALVAFVKAHITVGDGFEDGSFMGPISHASQFNRVKQYLADIETTVLTLLTGNTKPLERKGFFIAPIIIDNPPETSRVVTEESFGSRD